MNLQQLRCVLEVSHNGLNVSAAAEALYTSQPGVSRHIRMLEDELGVRIFTRSGRHLSQITPDGKVIVEMAGRVLEQMDNLRQAARELSDERRGSLAVATTYSEARSVLDPVIRSFRKRYPEVALCLNRGAPKEIATLTAQGVVDLAIAAETPEQSDELILLPCYRWTRCVIVPVDHPLRKVSPLSLEAIAAYPLINQVASFTGRSLPDKAFHARGLKPNVVMTTADADVVQHFVGEGLGVGIVARLDCRLDADSGLRSLEAGDLFPIGMTRLALRRGAFIRGYIYDFIELLAPSLRREIVDQAMQTKNAVELEHLLRETDLPRF